jgi:hypothetical protein
VVESVVLAYLITERPQGMTILMLSLYFNAEFDQGVEGSAVERAVRELVRDGQLRMQGGKVVPGRPGPTASAAQERAGVSRAALAKQ